MAHTNSGQRPQLKREYLSQYLPKDSASECWSLGSISKYYINIINIAVLICFVSILSMLLVVHTHTHRHGECVIYLKSKVSAPVRANTIVQSIACLNIIIHLLINYVDTQVITTKEREKITVSADFNAHLDALDDATRHCWQNSSPSLLINLFNWRGLLINDHNTTTTTTIVKTSILCVGHVHLCYVKRNNVQCVHFVYNRRLLRRLRGQVIACISTKYL